ncbi:hypothetical protein [Paenibacillus methanolicus]|uniref:Uncharacterized protein n=1 Tax=Paenibacillus methanolicus TaxID=582686 RepID=A0A5S5C6C2_9BACL|nr:hypothetical protein [Paenibacillus methanolicus]TYP74857.1 hypothetical protein BCM02_105404 [Paenibacillus methanolicus]
MRIIYGDLWTYSILDMIKRVDQGIEPRVVRLPISELRMTDTIPLRGQFEIHVHDRKMWIIGNASAPEEMMIDDWLYTLKLLFTRLEAGCTSYKMSTGEQGGAVYLFEREGEMLFLSVFRDYDRDSLEPIEDWQRVPMTYESFRRGYLDFRRRLYNELKEQAPEGYRLYFKEDLPAED